MTDIILLIAAVAYILVPAIACNLYVKNYFISTIISTLIAVTLLFLTDYIKFDFTIGPFTMIAMKNAFLIYMVTAAIIGVPFLIKRKRSEASKFKKKK